MAFVRSSLKTGSAPGPTPSEYISIVNNGQICNSDPGEYLTVTFDDINDYEYVFVRVRDTVNGAEYVSYWPLKVSDMPAGGEIDRWVSLHRSVHIGLSRTSIRTIEYSGSWQDIYADIVVCVSDPFDVLT